VSFPRIVVSTLNHAIAAAVAIAVILSEVKDPDTLDQPSPPNPFNGSCFPTAENHHHHPPHQNPASRV